MIMQVLETMYLLKSGSFILGDKGKELEISIAKFIGASHGTGLERVQLPFYFLWKHLGLVTMMKL
ncbi:hypothetical protein [Peribacillus frigoritolerans]|uniref:hypothetical protein n=1 Tax=Peribacillus frigoritolerans TaxID=450367 RepID=UPI00203BC043|nr:hypothetical protein [Peribacillus frigoritolerans]